MEEQIKAQYEIIGTLVRDYELLVRKKIKLEREVDILRANKTRKEYQTREIVYSEVDEETGKKKHSNEELRNIATQKILETDAEYQKIKSAVDNFEEEINKEKGELDIVYRRLTAAYSQADLLVALANFKASGIVKAGDLQYNAFMGDKQ